MYFLSFCQMNSRAHGRVCLCMQPIGFLSCKCSTSRLTWCVLLHFICEKMFYWIPNQSLHLNYVLNTSRNKPSQYSLSNLMHPISHLRYLRPSLTCSIETGSVSNESNLMQTSKPPSFLKHLEDRNLCQRQIEMNISDLLPLHHRDTFCFVFF